MRKASPGDEMNKIAVFVMGPDRPGIIASVAGTLFKQGCNLEDVSQTILQTIFVGIFIGSLQDGHSPDSVLAALRKEAAPMGLAVHLDHMSASLPDSSAAESFVVTTIGPDRPGLVAGISELLASYSVNITNLKAVFRGGNDPNRNVMIYEIDIPDSLDQDAFRNALYARAQALGLDISLQHREIFEQIHRV